LILTTRHSEERSDEESRPYETDDFSLVTVRFFASLRMTTCIFFALMSYCGGDEGCDDATSNLCDYIVPEVVVSVSGESSTPCAMVRPDPDYPGILVRRPSRLSSPPLTTGYYTRCAELQGLLMIALMKHWYS
jgi:hypothetical protein